MTDLIGQEEPLKSSFFASISRDSWLAIGLFIVLALVTAVSLYQQTVGQPVPPLTAVSTQPDGARAFWLWLEEMGYEVTDRVWSTFQIPENTAVVLILSPNTFILDDEWDLIDDWVDDGGTLILGGTDFLTDQLFRHYDFEIDYRNPTTDEAFTNTPLMASPPSEPILSPLNSPGLVSQRDDYVTLFALDEMPVAVSFEQENGRVVLTTQLLPFTNTGLRSAGSPAFVLNLISIAGDGRGVWFDEWHHGVRVGRDDSVVGLSDWIRQTPIGRSFLYIAGVVFVALLLRGRQFGRPVPLAHSQTRRAPLEYITALANLSRRAGHRQATLNDYHYRLKKHVGLRYRLDPALPDAEFLAQLEGYQANLDLNGLRGLLGRLSNTAVSEAELIQIAAEVAVWLKK